MPLILHHVSFRHAAAQAPLFSELTLHFPQGWTGIVGANGTGKTTLLRLAGGDLRPDRGSVQASGRVVYCAQRTDTPPQRLNAFLRAEDKTSGRLRTLLRVADHAEERWADLSHGERKRIQIAVALWQQPWALALDEPTNHIDAETRDFLQQALQRFDGVGLLVSHDRALLDSLCGQCVFLEPPGAVLRPGGYSQGVRQAEQERSAAARQRQRMEQELGRIERERHSRAQAASQADRKRSKRGLARQDHDARERVNRARVSGKDGQAGRLKAQLAGRARRLQEELGRCTVSRRHDTGIWLPGARSRRDRLVSLPAGALPLGEGRWLRHPPLHLGPADRVGITGPNGAGKSTLLLRLLAETDLDPATVLFLPQELDAGHSHRILTTLRSLDSATLGRVMTLVSRLGSRPERLLDTMDPSPGELRKLWLAMGIMGNPHLVVLDEPTNHLDLPATACLEAALSQCPCGLLLVSHDLHFLHGLCRVRWHIHQDTLSVDEAWQ